MLFSGVEFNFLGLNISMYGIMMAIAFIVGIFIAYFNAKKRNIKPDDILTLAIYVIPLSILGARTYFVIFTEKIYSFWEFFEIWNGGLAILGGVIGGLLGVVLYSLIHKKNLIDLMDIAAPSLILGQAIGRIGCFFAGCCYGYEITDTNLMLFPVGIETHGAWHYATQFYECFWCFAFFWLLYFVFRKTKLKGLVTCLYLVIYGLGRFFIEMLRGDSLYLFSTGIKVSQALSLLIFIIGTIGLIFILIKDRRKKCSI